MDYQPPLQMSRNAPRAYRRMYREVEPPYRLHSISVRLERFRPFASSPLNTAMEIAVQRTNIELLERRQRFIVKRQSQHHSTNQRRLSVHINPMRSNFRELEIIPPVERARYPNQYSTRWQADEPQIVITSDVQLQTDEVPPTDTTTDVVVSSTNSMRLRTVYEEVSSTSTEYVSSTRTSFSPNIVTDRGTQIPCETYETIEIIDLDPEDPNTIEQDQEETNTINVEPEGSVTLELNQENSTEQDNTNAVIREIIDLDADADDDVIDLVSSDKSDSEEDTASEMTYKLYARPAFMPDLPASTLESRQVANRLIRHARNNKTLNVKWLYCLDCGLFPSAPVTGQCGHTRCSKCIKNNGPCPCGAKAPRGLFVNTVIQNLLTKMQPNKILSRGHSNSVLRSVLTDGTVSAPSAVRQGRGMFAGRARSSLRSSRSLHASRSGRASRSLHASRSGRASRSVLPNRSTARDRERTSYVGTSDPNVRLPMSPQVQFDHACGLIAAGLLRQATPHLARVAASSAPVAHSARSHLSQVVVALSAGRDPRRLARNLFGLVRQQSAGSWLRVADLECVLCYHTYVRPVTTPCGHTYCKTCIERALDYRKLCALCQRPLHGFDPTRTLETTFVRAALQAIDAYTPPPPSDPNVIPIFVCTVAYPAIPCPLFIFDPRYWLMIRRVLESGSRKFGMVAYERDRRYSEYGTVLQVCDCVQLEDGRSFLSTVGVSRFRITGRDVMDGCDMARIQPLTDIIPSDRLALLDVRLLGSQIMCKALMWLNGMNHNVRLEIEAAFGQIPRFDHTSSHWWDTTDGPSWLWWLIAILPLRPEIKVLILSTKNLMKRMMAVSRTLEAVDQVAINTTATAACAIRSALSNAEDWLERGS